MFGWFKRKKKTQLAVVDSNDLYGHDLAVWNYIGRTQCTYCNKDKVVVEKHPVFLFAKKDDSTKRSFAIPTDTSNCVRRTHPYVLKYINLWAAGEESVYGMIAGEENKPSDYLKQYMLEEYAVEWNEETNWWDTSDKAKYNAAKQKQSKKGTLPNHGSGAQKDPVVIQVEFGKKNEG